MGTDSNDERLRGRVDILERLIADIERSISAFGDEIRTRQLVVVDDDDHPRIVGEVFADVAELRLELPPVNGEPGPELLLFAVGSTHPGPLELGPGVGLQLRAQGRAVFELDAWPDTDGVWRPHLHVSAT
ncbi:MAG: hypothetical protein ACRDVW_08710 [Acidimicrobiales bacterium]